MGTVPVLFKARITEKERFMIFPPDEPCNHVNCTLSKNIINANHTLFNTPGCPGTRQQPLLFKPSASILVLRLHKDVNPKKGLELWCICVTLYLVFIGNSCWNQGEVLWQGLSCLCTACLVFARRSLSCRLQWDPPAGEVGLDNITVTIRKTCLGFFQRRWWGRWRRRDEGKKNSHGNKGPCVQTASGTPFR